MTHKTIANQQEPVRQRIYGSTDVHPIEGAANQPEVLPHVRPYGGKSLSTIRVTLKGNDKELVINEADFDSDRHERLE